MWYHCAITVPSRRFTTMSMHIHLYLHLSFILSSSQALWQPHCEKGDLHTTLFTNTKVYSLLQFLSSCQEKEREYESCVDCMSWTKRNMSWRKRKSRHRPWIFMLARWFCLHRFVSGVRPLAHPQNRGGKFLSVLTSSRLVFNSCLYLFASAC